MKTVLLVETACDISEAAIEDAWIKLGKPEHCSLVVGTKAARYVRNIAKNTLDKPISVFICPDWTDEWMLNGEYISIFSEGA